MDFTLAKSNPCGKSGALRGCPPLEGVASDEVRARGRLSPPLLDSETSSE